MTLKRSFPVKGDIVFGFSLNRRDMPSGITERVNMKRLIVCSDRTLHRPDQEDRDRVSPRNVCRWSFISENSLDATWKGSKCRNLH